MLLGWVPSPHMNNTPALLNEFDTQVQTLLKRGYPASITQLVNPLRNILTKSTFPHEINFSEGKIPFVIVVKDTVVPADSMMQKVEKDSKKGVIALPPLTIQEFSTISSVFIPENSVYLLLDIDRGKQTRNITPQDALNQIFALGRSPLTIEEGIALVTHYPEFLMKNNCFSLLASRTGIDKRVPAIWINATKQPNLGWCWDGNPHTWLGSASCVSRAGPP